ncbi:phosphate ABC transporter substrate-binding protein PstS family protein [Salipaludibacillus agaradhaerens]|uniref:Phosphate-binding protein n=1 Tax=Salipaludibacillus agaradhaerens TaxID=76935 RepID=A0A9Q4AZL0_SALAG|nr:phosphate ABC transporter substrate-binding protein PstS family protein [Salipaludibacillus agaradhaerens]MCR6095677.1 phosphate ABC transporter substrate-binding protein PstS family protein [Salipaludibacillus agaradhaerens]MCR6114763.1 phosphate ABC transporter substrate-binding protein PstS family protein [Salipaludibacillus agaradhaerens]
MKLKKYSLSFLMAGLMVVTAACGGNENTAGGDSDTNSSNNNDSSSEELSGTVIIDGSGTVYPLMSRIAEEYMVEEQEGVSVEVSRGGTSAGMSRFVAGETDLSNASREIREEELAELEENGIETQEFKVALDGLTIVIHPDNDWASDMTEEEIKTMFVTGNYADDDNVMWSDIRSDWPHEPVNFYGPNENHGTHEFFVEEIIEEQDLVDTINLQQEYSTLVNLISEDEHGIGFFGYGYYANNTDDLQAVAIDFGDGPVAPSLETIAEDGDYAPFTRPVFTNLSYNSAREKAEVKDFAEYVFTVTNQFAEETGFAPLPEDELEGYINDIQAIN